MTTSAAVQMYLFIHLGVILVVTAYYTVSAALAPGLAQRSRERFAKRPWATAFLGLGVSIPWVVLAIFSLNAPAGTMKFLGGVALGLWVLCGLIGGAGIAQHIGSHNTHTHPQADWTQTVRGGLLVSLTWVLPLVGWIGMLPLTLATGVGCLVKDLFSRNPQDLPETSGVAPTAE